jgi:hypothetical protein
MRNQKRNFQKRICLLLVILSAALSNAGCYMHSDEREALAKDVQSRYASVLPAGSEALESLDKDLEQLLASKRADFEVLKETAAIELVDLTWGELISRTDSLNKRLFQTSVKIANGKREDADAAAALKTKIDAFDDKLGVMDKAIGEIENKKTLQERLDQSKDVIKQVTTALTTLLPPPGTSAASPVDARLSQALGDINQYLGTLNTKRDKTEKTYSLILEALRLGRDVTALEQESLQQELSFHQRRIGFFVAEERLVKQIEQVPVMLDVFIKYGRNEHIQKRIELLSREGESGQTESARKLRNILEQLGSLQALRITTESHIREIDLRLEVEKYRNARLLDAIYERQRMSLISYGLEGVVRYSQGGLRAQDIARLTNIAQMIAQIVIAVRVGN